MIAKFNLNPPFIVVKHTLIGPCVRRGPTGARSTRQKGTKGKVATKTKHARQSANKKTKVQIKNQSSTQTWKTQNYNIPWGDWKQKGIWTWTEADAERGNERKGCREDTSCVSIQGQHPSRTHSSPPANAGSFRETCRQRQPVVKWDSLPFGALPCCITRCSHPYLYITIYAAKVR